MALMIPITLALWLGGCHKGADANDQQDRGRAPTGTHAAAQSADSVSVDAQEQRQIGIVLVTATLQRIPEAFTTTVPITLPAGRTATVYSPISGTLQLLGTRSLLPGSPIHAGEPLARVRPTYSASQGIQMRISLQAAQTQINAARARLAADHAQALRSSNLYRDGVAPLAQVQRDQAAEKADEAALENAQIQEQEFRAALNPGSTNNPSVLLLRSPITGVVSSVQAVPGQLVDPTQSLFTIVDARQIWIEVPVPESVLASAGRASTGAFSIDAYPGEWFPMTRVGSSDVVDPHTHVLPVIFAASNRGNRFHSGMVATAELLTPARLSLPVVPSSALVHEGAVTVIFVAAGAHRFVRRPVQVSYESAGQVAIQTGLQPGERVVTQGAALLESELHVGSAKGDD